MKRLAEEELLREIEKYFDCHLSDEEEQQLKHALLDTTSTHPTVKEVKAVMGFSEIKQNLSSLRRKKHQRVSIPLRVFQTVAASLILFIIGAGIVQISSQGPSSSECLALIDGKIIADDEVVLKIMEENVEEMNSGLSLAQAEVDDEMESIFPILEKLDSDMEPTEI